MDAIELGQALGRIEANLAAHTTQDAENFRLLNEKLDRFDVEPLVRRVALKWASGVGVVVAAVAQIAAALGFLP